MIDKKKIYKKRVNKKKLDTAGIEKDVEYGLNYLEQMERIELDHHFDIRVQAAAASLDDAAGAFTWNIFSSKGLKPAFVLILCIVNILTVAYFSGILSWPPSHPNTIETQYARAVEAAYSLQRNEHDLKLIRQMRMRTNGTTGGW